MRKLIGSLVAGTGGERMAARPAVGIHPQFQCNFLCGQFLDEDLAAHRVHAATNEGTMRATARTGFLVAIVRASEDFINAAVEKTASAVLPGCGATV